jgi:hypothetical protein
MTSAQSRVRRNADEIESALRTPVRLLPATGWFKSWERRPYTLESWPGRYEALLAESVRRKPSPLTVWMVNRILNARSPDADAWLTLLRCDSLSLCIRVD